MKEYFLSFEQLVSLEDHEHVYIKTKPNIIGTPIYYFKFRNSIIKYELNIWEHTAFFDFKIKGKISDIIILKASEVVHRCKRFILDFEIPRSRYNNDDYLVQLGFYVIPDLNRYAERVSQNFAEMHIDKILHMINHICNKPKPVQNKKHYSKYHYIHLYGEDSHQLVEALTLRGIATYKRLEDHSYYLYIQPLQSLTHFQRYTVIKRIVRALCLLGFQCFITSEDDALTKHIKMSRELAYGTHGLGSWFYPVLLVLPFGIILIPVGLIFMLLY